MIVRVLEEFEKYSSQIDFEECKVTYSERLMPLMLALREVLAEWGFGNVEFHITFYPLLFSSQPAWPWKKEIDSLDEYVMFSGGKMPDANCVVERFVVTEDLLKKFPIVRKFIDMCDLLALGFDIASPIPESPPDSLNEDASINGKSGVDQREIERWRNRTKELIEFSEGDFEKDALLEQFLTTRKEGNRAKDKIRYFIGTLLNHPWNCREGELMKRFHNPNSGIRSEKDKNARNRWDSVVRRPKPGSPMEPVKTEEVAIAERRFSKDLVRSMKKVPKEAILQCHQMLYAANLIKEVR